MSPKNNPAVTLFIAPITRSCKGNKDLGLQIKHFGRLYKSKRLLLTGLVQILRSLRQQVRFGRDIFPWKSLLFEI
jgi:hypothetical protein